MSSHTSSHDHGSRGDSIFATAKNWFASKSPSHKNSLSSIDATGNNLVKGLVKSTTGWFADILNPLGTAAMNGVSLFSPSKYREHGWKNIPKSISGIVSHVVDSANNLIAGSTFRGLDHMYTHGVTDSLVDITSGTTDRIPGVGKFAGNVVKGANVIPAAPIRFLARAWEKTADALADWMKKFSTVKTPARHLTTAHAKSGQSDHH